MVNYRNFDEQMADLDIEEEENESFVLEGDSEEEVNRYDLCLVGRFLTGKTINARAMKSKMADIWRPTMGITINEIDQGIFLFQFYHKEDLQWVMGGGSWTFDNAMLLLEMVVVGEEPLKVQLWFLNIWIQIFDLPMGFMTEAVGKQLRNFFGEFLQYDIKNNTSIWREFMRIRIRLDVRKPLKRRKKIDKKDGSEFVVTCKYERWGEFCFSCGLVSHTDRFCRRFIDRRNVEGEKEWGVWLKTQPHRAAGKGHSKWLKEEDDATWEERIGRDQGYHIFRGGGGDSSNRNRRIMKESESRELVVKGLRDNSNKISSSNNTNLEGFNTCSNLLYGLLEEDSIGPKNEGCKRRRGDPTSIGIMDVDGGLQLIGSQVTQNNEEAVISNGDLAASTITLSAKLAGQASRSQRVSLDGTVEDWAILVQVFDFSQNHIDIIVDEGMSNPWRLSCFYGFPERERRHESWNFLRNLSSRVRAKGRRFHLGKEQRHSRLDQRKIKQGICKRLLVAFVSLCTLTVSHVIASDHDPIKTELVNATVSKKIFRFKFENTWLKEEEFSTEVSKFWLGLSPSHLLPKLIYVSSFMERRGRNFFHKFREKVLKQKAIIDELKNREDDDGIQMYYDEKEKLNDLLLHEELYWKQHAKAFWLEEGDSNSNFFHAIASNRKKMNHIESLKSEDGRLVTDHEELCSMLKRYYINVFAVDENVSTYLVHENEARISSTQNEMLTANLTFEEFSEAVKSMHPDKASAPDGLNPAFFQHFWNLLGREVFKCRQDWLLEESFSPGTNDTTLVLIPKKEKIEEIKDLRPIALCNVLYKIVAKVLANRLQKILPVMISEEQSAFVPGRNITDNVLVAFELIHYMKRKFSGQDGEVALKLDISKAYDRVCWDYLRSRMVAMGFSQKWIRWMMLCVTSVSYSISFQVSNEEASSIKEILKSYELFSGQAVNYQKLDVFFNANVRRDKQEEIKRVLNDKIWQRIQVWSMKLLSKTGKAVLIRKVAQFIPSYTMSCFMIPKSLCLEIERMMNAFWWKSNSSDNKGIRWLAWERMSMSKKRGGLGFRDLHGFNLALLGKQCWNIIHNPGALVSRVLKAKYFPYCHLLQANRTGGASYTWSGIWEAKEVLKEGMRWILGDGKEIKNLLING
ncbi:uncharacterized protein LOC141717092 [Apium graveolens]|uniref:uncharacterized protein LOC141717092 n=1 Tax=Apium graveolens TaxID=4045 RepID=UPI003D7BE7A9